MASTTVNKFFKYGVKGDLTSTVDTLLGQLIQASPSGNGIGILVDNTTNKRIIGLTAKDAKIDFTTLGGGSLSSVANSTNVTFTDAAGHTSDVTFGVTSGSSSYFTIDGSTAGSINYGLTQAVYTANSTSGAGGSFTTAGVLASSNWNDYGKVTVSTANGPNQVGAKLIMTQGNLDDVITIMPGSGTYTVDISQSNGNQLVFGLNSATQTALTNADSALQGFTIDGVSAVTNKIGDIETTGVAAGTGATAPYDASTNPVATKAYVDAVDTKYNHTLTVASDETTPTSFGTWTPTADGTITIDQYAGSTAGLVPAKTNTTASTGYYLAENGTWQQIPAAPTITFGSDAASNNTAAIKVKVNNNPVSNTVTLTAAQNTTAINTETLGITITGDANTPTIGLTSDTINELALAHTALQPVTAVSATDMFSTSTNSDGDITVTAKSYAQATTAQSTVAAGTESFTVGNGKLVWNNGTNNVVVFSANQSADVTLNKYDFKYASGTLGLNTNTATSSSNKIATMADIASLSGAMHYKGGVTAYPTPTADTKAGDTYVVTASFTHGGVTYEVGDMLVANSDGASATYTVVQSNLTIGIADGQIAKNDGALTATQIVTATANGIATTGFTFDAEGTLGTTTIGSSSTDAQVPTSKNVYDYVTAAIAADAVQSVSEATAVSAHNSTGATITDTLTVDGAAQTGNAFNIDAVASSGITVAPKSGSTDTVEIGTTAPGFTATDNDASVTFATTATTGIAHGSDLDTMATGISDLFEWQVVTLS